MSQEGLWLVWGFAGQAMFGSRFVIQWLYSEIKKESVVPRVFWYISLIASLMLLLYAVYRKDPVFAAGFCLNIPIYIRNLILLNKKNKNG